MRLTILILLASSIALPALAQQPMDDHTKCGFFTEWLRRYDYEKGSQHLSGRRMNTDVAGSLCAQGREAEGAAILERTARDAGYAGN
jgi:hypothetical protein